MYYIRLSYTLKVKREKRIDEEENGITGGKARKERRTKYRQRETRTHTHTHTQRERVNRGVIFFWGSYN